MKLTAILVAMASLQSHGFSGDSVPYPELEAQLARGERIVVSCGTITNLGVRAVRRAGGQARVVATLTRDPLTGKDDGHTLFEVRTKRGWTVFDLDANRRAPWGVGIAEQVDRVERGKGRWVIFADDPLYDESEADKWPPMREIYADLDRWYAHVFGIPLYYHEGEGFFFRDIWEYEDATGLGYQWASAERWRKLTGEAS